jgi:hypothetical protein
MPGMKAISGTQQVNESIDSRPKSDDLIPFRVRGSHILREAFQRNLVRVGRSLLCFVGGVLDESALQHVVRFVAPTLALAALDRPPKFERYAMHGLGGKRELIAIELTRLKKVIQKNAAIAFRVAVARNKAGNASLVFDSNLHELAVAQKTIHARVVRPGGCWTLPIRVRLRASKHQREEDETRKLQRVETGCVERHVYLGTVSIAVMIRMRAKRDAGQQPLEVSYNLATE